MHDREICSAPAQTGGRNAQGEQHWDVIGTDGDAINFESAAVAVSPDSRHIALAAASGRSLLCHVPLRPQRHLHVATVLPDVAAGTFFRPLLAWHPAGGHIVISNAAGRLDVRILDLRRATELLQSRVAHRGPGAEHMWRVTVLVLQTALSVCRECLSRASTCQDCLV